MSTIKETARQSNLVRTQFQKVTSHWTPRGRASEDYSVVWNKEKKFFFFKRFKDIKAKFKIPNS